MRDADVRAALHTLLRREHAHEIHETRFLNELSLCGQVRVDVAVMNGEFAGYELKSERDTLTRLPVQIDVYSRVLDRATLVVAARHYERALRVVPAWWGVVVARSACGTTQLCWERRPQLNPGICAGSLAQLLWRAEVLDELTMRDLDCGVRSANRRVLWAKLSEGLSLEDLRAVVRERLKHRAGWRVDSLPPRGDAGFRSAARS